MGFEHWCIFCGAIVFFTFVGTIFGNKGEEIEVYEDEHGHEKKITVS